MTLFQKMKAFIIIELYSLWVTMGGQGILMPLTKACPNMPEYQNGSKKSAGGHQLQKKRENEQGGVFLIFKNYTVLNRSNA